jgi:hypothetical protein
MTPARATAYVGLASVLVAWLAGASGLTGSSSSPQPPAPRAETSATQVIANEVQLQASRLRVRLAAAPVPREPSRNPFTFASAVVHQPGATTTARKVAAPATPVPPPERPLQLVGVAEQETPTGAVRTAMITADSDELFMVAEGDTLGGRYRVKAVGQDVVELVDLVTSATRRLSLR